MAQSFVTDAGTLIIPGAYPSIKVEQSNSGLSTTGVLMLIGEADAGPDYGKETELSLNSFGPDQAADVIAKYKSGSLVDAFRAATAPANDADIQGAFSRAIIIKSNVSAKASSLLAMYPSGDWVDDDGATIKLQDKSYGKLGNLIYYEVVTKTAEVLPTTGAFTLLSPIAATNVEFRVNGGAAEAASLAPQSTPAAFVSAVNALAGLAATGGVDRDILGEPVLIPGTLALTVLGGPGSMTVRVDFSAVFAATPVAGDLMWIKTGSVLAGGGGENLGSYVVTIATNASITAVKLLDATGGPPNQLTAPVNVPATPAADEDVDVVVYSPVTVSVLAGVPVNGRGKSLEFAQLTSGPGLFEYLAYALSVSPVTFLSKLATPSLIVSAAEYVAQININRQIDNVQENLSGGGAIALKLSYVGTTASAVVDEESITLTVVGGSGTSPGELKFADYPTIGDLANYLSTLTGFKASAGTAAMASQASSTLDTGTFTFASKFGAYNGRIKQDAYKFKKLVNENSAVAEISPTPTSGLPAPQSMRYLAGGTKGATTDASFSAAVDALELVRGNFVVPLFSRDATDDIVDGLTDSGSTYTIDAIHTAVRAHCLKMATLKRRRNRQGFLSFKGSFDSAKTKSANMASFRCSMTFQDAKDTNASGSIAQFQPWMSSVKAAAMQAAGFYRPIVHKFINISGALQAAGDFTDQDDTKVEDALIAGLLPIRRAETGGFYWVSDQTTYGKDSNFVFNSIQATYVADVIALTTAQRMENAFVGQSTADVSASLAITVLESIMDDLRRLKLITVSDDAPKGFKNAIIKINGPSMVVSIEVKLAGAIYFIPISFLVSQVHQVASL